MSRSSFELVPQRLNNQKLTRSTFREPSDVVTWLGAVQSQEYPSAKWAVSLRAKGLEDADIERAFNEGAILRTHVLRPTWHFVAPTDIRWMLALTGPRVNTVCGHYYRKLELDAKTFTRTRHAFERALQGGQQLTRSELASVLQRARIVADRMQVMFLVLRAELDGVICSGPRKGKQFTYMLLDERVPHGKMLDGDEALAELARRYFASHGPATIKDFVWWSGLTVRQAKMGIDAVKPALVRDVVGERTYWSAPSSPSAARASSSAYLLPNYDEYLIAYRDRGPKVLPYAGSEPSRWTPTWPHQVVINGQVVGAWRRTPAKSKRMTPRPAVSAGETSTGSMSIEASLFRSITRQEQSLLESAVERYGQFVGLPAKLSIV